DPAPLEREAIRAEAQFGAEPDVGGIAMPVVAGVAARFLTGRIDRVLPRPPVVVPVTAFHLVGGRCRTPDEAVRKAPPVGQMRARSHTSSTPGSLTYAPPSPGVSIRQRVRPSPPPSRSTPRGLGPVAGHDYSGLVPSDWCQTRGIISASEAGKCTVTAWDAI